jgi:hypothetical protein
MADGPRAPQPRPSARVVRPYVLTRGRTHAPDATFALEAQVHAAVAADRLERGATPEARRIVECCRTPVSIAELAAHLSLPLGVTRVLVGDLVAAGAVSVHVGVPDAEHDAGLLERLLDGIRAL